MIDEIQSVGIIALAISQLCLGIAFFVHMIRRKP